MSELISGKDAKLAWANGEKVQRKCSYTFDWKDITSRDNLDIFDLGVKYRRKPRTIKLNGIEVPEIEGIYILSNANNTVKLKCKTNEDALKVKEALRSIFNESS